MFYSYNECFERRQNCTLLQSLGCGMVCAALQMCAMCGCRNFQKCEAGAFSFFFFISRLCPVALSVKSSQSGMKVGLCHYMSVVTLHCQCVRCLFFCMCPNEGINVLRLFPLYPIYKKIKLSEGFCIFFKCALLTWV